MPTQYIKKGSAPRPADGGIGIGMNSSSEVEFRQIVSGVDTTRKLPLISGGSAPIATVAVSEKIGVARTTILSLNAVPLTVRDTEQGGGVKIFDFPQGRILILGAVAKDLAVTTTSAIASTLNSGVSCRIGVGTTTQANPTLATTEQDIIPVTTFTSSTTINVPAAAVDAALAASAQWDGTGTAIDAFLNISVPTATDIDANASVTVTGTLFITWIDLGND